MDTNYSQTGTGKDTKKGNTAKRAAAMAGAAVVTATTVLGAEHAGEIYDTVLEHLGSDDEGDINMIDSIEDDIIDTDPANNGGGHHTTHTQPEPQPEPSPAPSNDGGYAPQHSDSTGEGATTTTVDISDLTNVDEQVVAQDLISGTELIDEGDHEGGSTYDVAEVTVVETIDGQQVTQATMIDANGEEYYMVDIDNDGNFDVQADGYGNEYAFSDNITTSDAELMASDSSSYMEPGGDNFDGTGFEADIIDTI